MAPRKDAVVYLDTHVVVWLYDALVDRLSDNARDAIERNELRISWMVKLELQYLLEIGRVRTRPDEIIGSLADSIGLRMADTSMGDIVEAALEIDWTRDTFDRLIAAESILRGCPLITKDHLLREHLPVAVW